MGLSEIAEPLETTRSEAKTADALLTALLAHDVNAMAPEMD